MGSSDRRQRYQVTPVEWAARAVVNPHAPYVLVCRPRAMTTKGVATRRHTAQHNAREALELHSRMVLEAEGLRKRR